MSEDLKQEALEFVREHPTSHLATVDGGKPMTRVMYTPRVDDDFTVWYATSGSSNKIRQVKADPNVCTVFYEDARWVGVCGQAKVVTDQEMKNELWEDDWTRYWPDGAENPDYVLMKATPESVDILDLTKPEAITWRLN